jgi:hypothetical protein
MKDFVYPLTLERQHGLTMMILSEILLLASGNRLK